MIGTIVGVIDHGTIVQMRIRTSEGHEAVNFDHRCFWNFYGAQGGKLLGLKVEVTGEPGEQVIEVL